MDFFSILSMIGGLALFLYGMHVMGDGLAKVSGGKMEKILESLTSNPLKAVGLGALVTAVIQSSSATTVMVVGFVNSGIMKLSQAVGVIMGANIGTTIHRTADSHLNVGAMAPIFAFCRGSNGIVSEKPKIQVHRTRSLPGWASCLSVWI